MPSQNTCTSLALWSSLDVFLRYQHHKPYTSHKPQLSQAYIEWHRLASSLQRDAFDWVGFTRKGFPSGDVSSLQDEGGEGAKELEEFHSDRMKVLQLDVCSDEQVSQAVEFIKDNLADAGKGNWLS